jgi:ABC-2 type transport system ATP-binding protein
MEYSLVVKDLKKMYSSEKRTVQALKGVSFKVKKGEIFGLLGPNGAGKTTTTNILTGILTADSGDVLFFGKKPTEEVRNRINAATAYKQLTGALTVYQNLKVYAVMYDVKNVDAKINELLERFHMISLKDRRTFTLSSGQKTLLNICKGLINDPEILFLDEATVGLDPHIAHLVRKEIKNLKTTVIFTSHMMNEVEELCDRIAFLSKGKILKIATPAGIKKLIKENTFIIEFISQPKHAATILDRLGAQRITKDKISISLKKQEDIQKIIHALITAGFEIRDLHIKRPTLDEVFIKVAQGEL